MTLFAFFGLWETTLLVGAGAVSVPVIIHLLNRRRYKVVTWAAMRFLLAAQKQNTRRIRLEQIILLLVRMALIALIVFAMASVMPWAESVWAAVWPDGSGVQATRGGRTHHILVLDGSMSMNLAGDGKSLFDRARQMALERVKNAPAGDGFSVLLMKDNPVWIVGTVSYDGRKVAREIEQLEAGHGNGSVPATLGMVAAKVAEGHGRFPVQNVYFFTDLQKSTWLNASGDGNRRLTPLGSPNTPVYQEIAKAARTIFVDLGQDDAKNLAVTDVRLDDVFITTGTSIRVSATITNFSQETHPNVRVDLLAGRAREVAADNPYSARTVNTKALFNLKPKESAAVDFVYKFTAPGTYALQVKLEGDALEPDDGRAIIVTVKDTIPVLLVNGKPAADPYDRATEYLKLALNPFPPGAEPKFAPLRPKVINAAQFADVSEAELAGYDCIFLCDVPQFGSGDLRRLEGHLRRGGGLIVSLGDRAADNLEVYNRLLYKNDGGLLPAQLIKKIVAPVDHHFTLNGQDDQFFEPPLKAFADDDDRLSLRTGRFRQYVQAKASSDSKIRTILGFMPELDSLTTTRFDKTLANDHPALIEWNPPLPRDGAIAPRLKDSARPIQARYRGKVLLFTSTLNMDWNSWPGSPSFGAMMQETTRVAAAGRLREQANLVGQGLEEYFPGVGNEVDATVYPPGENRKPQKVRTQNMDDTSVFRYADTERSGIFKVTVGSDPREFLFAVNVPMTRPDQGGSESDLTRLDKSQLQAAFPDWDFQLVNDPRQANYDEGGPAATDIVEAERGAVGPILANIALILALILIFAETILAWRFGHYSAVEGLSSQAATGIIWPLAVAIVAGLIFVTGAWVLIHATQTGDFLGFLPDGMRAWVESNIGIPPPPAGENTRWDLEHRHWLPFIADETWFAGVLTLAAVVLIFFTYRAEGSKIHPAYKALMGALRVFLILITMAVLLPQLQLRFDRQGWPDIVVLIDDSRSMGEPDVFQDEKTRDRAKKLGELARKKLQDSLPDKMRAVAAEIAAKSKQAANNPELQIELEALEVRLQGWQSQLNAINSSSWRPSRLQLAQALISQPEQDWLSNLLNQRRSKVHIYHLDMEGRAVKLTDTGGPVGEITDNADPRLLERAQKAVANLEAEGHDSRLGTALRQVIDYYRGSALSAVIMITDGVTTKDETIQQVGDYAAQKAVPLYFVGIGDDHEIRDLKLHELQVADTIYVGDRVIFEARLTGKGYKDLTVPVVLKVKDKDGKEKTLEETRKLIKIDPSGKDVKIRLLHQPTEVGRKLYIVEVEVPKADRGDKGPNLGNLRLERTIDVLDAKLTRVLYIEGQPRYEYRFVKSLLERESPDAKKNKSVDLRVLLLDADAEFARTDKSALADFPATQAELEQYDVVILGDANPKHPMLGKARLKMLADFVRGPDGKGQNQGKAGTGLLMLAGPLYAPHAYKDTPLAAILPIELTGKPPAEPAIRDRPFRMELTPVGRLQSMFRFDQNEAANMEIWKKLPQMYWWSTGYRLKPLAKVLAVHPTEKAFLPGPDQDARHPLVVEHLVGSGRCMFIGVDEIWRWRFREEDDRMDNPFNTFWIQTSRYLSRTRVNKTDLRLDRQTPYRAGEPIKVTVSFPENITLPAGEVKASLRPDVKVTMEYSPKDGTPGDSEPQTLSLKKLEGSFGSFEGVVSRTREGKYRFRLMTPDVSRQQPDGEKPSAEATVETLPGELDRLRMNQQEMTQAAEASQGRFYTLATADNLLADLPPGFRVSLSNPRPPLLLWNHWLMFVLVLGVITAEWLLRKRKHLL
jgi:Aerotolerance regulator N-terminal/von Willebrand factor type A domain